MTFSLSRPSTERPLAIYLSDPVHDYVRARDMWVIPLNILSIAAYLKASFGKSVKIRLFKFPGEVFRAIKESPPDIIGISNYIWNSELSKTILRFVKEHSPSTVTAMGGPNVTQTTAWMTPFMNEARCDYYVSLAGELTFKCLVEAILKSGTRGGQLHEDPVVHGVWYLDPVTKTALSTPSTHSIKDLDEIPSPYVTGLADDFFRQDLISMVETSRGCPFKCTYCDWGDATLGRVYTYSVERVKADLDYCRDHATDERLLIADANFGLFPSRDLEIALYIRDMRDRYGWPGKVIVTWGQTKSEATLQIAEELKDLCMMTQSSQSLSPIVLKNIKRKNISDAQWKKSIRFCRSHSIEVYGEVMVPLPGESLESYLEGLRYLFDLGVDFLNSNMVMLLEGAEMSTSQQRKAFRMRTRWRLLENCYGAYEGRKAFESQEMLIQTATFSSEDYFFCRTLSWIIQMSKNLRRHELLLRLLHSFGINPVDFFIRIIRNHKTAPRSVKELFENFDTDAKRELFPTREALISFYSKPEQLECLRNGGFRKLNTYYTGRVSLECEKEFVDYYETIASELAGRCPSAPSNYQNMIRESAQFVRHHYLTKDDIARLEKRLRVEKEMTFHYDLLRWNRENNGAGMWDYHVPDGLTYRFFTDREQEETIRIHLKRFSGISREYQMRKLQEPFFGIHKKHLLFRVQRTSPCSQKQV